MSVAKGVNLALSFILELGMLAAFAYWGVETGSRRWLSIVLAVVIPLAAAGVWGAIMAPKASAKLDEPWHTVVALVIFALASAALFATGLPLLAWIYLGLAVVNRTVRLLWRQ